MSQVHEQIQLLCSPTPMDRLRGASALGKMGARLRRLSEVLSAKDYSDATMSLEKALRDRDSPLIRAEAAWALGQIGGVAAMRRLLYRLEEVLPAPGAGREVLGAAPGIGGDMEKRADVIASLVAAVGQCFSEEVLRDMDEDAIYSLKQRQEILLQRVEEEPDENMRVALVETLVALGVRTARAGLEPLTDLTALLCRTDSIAVLAAIALLKEAVPNAREIATRWYNRSGSQEADQEVEVLLKDWRQQLGECCPDRERLLEWLDMAAVLWSLQETAKVV